MFSFQQTDRQTDRQTDTGKTICPSITCIQRPLKGSNESGLLQQVVFKYRFYQVAVS